MTVGRHDTVDQFNSLLTRYEIVLIAVTVVVYASLLTAALLFWHRRRGRASRRHSNPIAEAAWVATVAALVGLLYYWTYTTEQRVDSASAAPGLNVTVTAAQWAWTFSYPGSGIVIHGSPQHLPTLVVPSNTVVRFRLTSRDVVHSLWIPVARFKRYALPGKWTSFELTFPRVGTSTGACAEFCGWGHDLMRYTLRVVPPAAFRAWLAAHTKAPA
jgi:cytochrome c oxidase subunit 2